MIGLARQPLDAVGGRPPVISNPFRGSSHPGADLTLEYAAGDADDDGHRVASLGGAPLYFTPHGWPARAAHDGVVVRADVVDRGWFVYLRHDEGWGTRYRHLTEAAVSAGDVVGAGDVLGEVGWDPSDSQGFAHLHFELVDEGGDHVDPAPHLDAAAASPSVVTDSDRAGLGILVGGFLGLGVAAVVAVGVALAARRRWRS